MWIAYSIPRIEDGNNFGVGIQVCIVYTVIFLCWAILDASKSAQVKGHNQYWYC